jgi:uncharacterized membrane protein
MERLKSFFSGKNAVVASATVVALTASAASNAALPPEVQAAIDALTTQVQDYSVAMWPVVILVFSVITGIALFKKFGRRAVS